MMCLLVLMAARRVSMTTASPVPAWVVELAATNPDPTYWGQVNFVTETAYELLRSGGRASIARLVALASASARRRRGWTRREFRRLVRSRAPLELQLRRARAGRIVRDLDFAHIFSGRDSPGTAMRRRSLRTESFDILNHWSQDIASCAGMLWCAILCFRVRPRGLVHFGPDCRSFSWLSRGHTGRSIDVVGNEHDYRVALGNVMVLFVSWVCTHLHFVQVYSTIEQPVCSCFKHHPAFLSLLERVPLYRFCTHMGAFDARLGIPKAVHIFSCALRYRRTECQGLRAPVAPPPIL